MTTLTSRLRSIALISAAAALALPLAACAQSSAPAAENGAGTDAGAGEPTTITDGTLTVCAALLSPPNVFTDEKSGEAVGVEVDIAQAFADQLGLKLALNNVAFPGLIPALQAKQCDTIMSSLYIKPEREEVVDFVPYLASGSAVITQKGNPSGITGYDESLCGKRVVVQTGSTGAKLIEELSAECTADGDPAVVITNTDSPGTAFQQVLAGQQDAHITTAESAGYYQKLGDFAMAGDPFGSIKVGAATLKDNRAMHDALEQALDTIIGNGDYAAILEEWGVQASDISATTGS